MELEDAELDISWCLGSQIVGAISRGYRMRAVGGIDHEASFALPALQEWGAAIVEVN